MSSQDPSLSQTLSPALSRADGGAALYIVATPIGNLGDMTARALETLREVDLIAAEDTRHSGRLLQHFAITTRLISYHDHSNSGRERELIGKLQAGRSVALISDAGTPLISDPGYGLVARAREQGIPVIPVPGASALTAALSAAGLPSDSFVFEGFPPAKTGARMKLFTELAAETRTLVFYESPHRIVACLRDLAAAFGTGRQAVVCRELTKTWETIHGDSLGSLNEWIEEDPNNQRGEFVVLIRGAEKKADQTITEDVDRVLGILLAELPVKQASALAAGITGVKKNLLYKHALERSS